MPEQDSAGAAGSKCRARARLRESRLRTTCGGRTGGRFAGWLAAPELAARQSLPRKFLEATLRDLRRASIVYSKLGGGGGFTLQRPADEITVAEVIRAIDGPLVTIRGRAPEDATYSGLSEPLQRVWIAARRSLRDVLEAVTVADLVEGRLPPGVARLADDEASW